MIVSGPRSIFNLRSSIFDLRSSIGNLSDARQGAGFHPVGELAADAIGVRDDRGFALDWRRAGTGLLPQLVDEDHIPLLGVGCRPRRSWLEDVLVGDESLRQPEL